jgi:hypothetical protein
MNKKQKQEEARVEMQKIFLRGNDDMEVNHCDADRLMLKVLRQEGYICAAVFFERIQKWYA